MKIGILSFYREINFGATLQALSTYKYLEKAGHFPVFINYDKSEDISDTTKYEDHFTGSNSLIAISKLLFGLYACKRQCERIHYAEYRQDRC